MAQAARVEVRRERLRPHLPNLVWGLRGVYGSAILEGIEILPDCVPQLADRGGCMPSFWFASGCGWRT
jgi:hypothetical protein